MGKKSRIITRRFIDHGPDGYTYTEYADGRTTFQDRHGTFQLFHRIEHPERIWFSEEYGWSYYGNPLPIGD